MASFRNLKARKMKQGHKEIFHYLAQNADPEGGYIWIHASSLGEFEQGRPIIEAIKAHYPEQKIAITFFSPSGYEVRKNYSKADLICYLPFDLPNNVNRFLNILKPKQAIFIKYEFWGNYLNALAKEIFLHTLFQRYSGLHKYFLDLTEAISEEYCKILNTYTFKMKTQKNFLKT